MDLEGQIVVESIRSHSQGLTGFQLNSVGSYLEATNGVATPPFMLQLMNSESQITFGNLGTSSPIDDWNSGVFYDLTLALDEATDPCTDLTMYGGSWERDGFCTIEGDTNFDGVVNFPDFLTLSANYGQSNAVWPQGDFDWDRQVGFSDFLSLRANFGRSIPELAADAQATTSVPEPSGIVLLLGVVTLAFIRRSIEQMRKHHN